MGVATGSRADVYSGSRAACHARDGQQFFVHNGGYHELLQNMMRMGIFGRLASRLLLLLVPLHLFARAARTGRPRRRACRLHRADGRHRVLTASLTSEVFNLIYAASFYGLLVAPRWRPPRFADEARRVVARCGGHYAVLLSRATTRFHTPGNAWRARQARL